MSVQFLLAHLNPFVSPPRSLCIVCDNQEKSALANFNGNLRGRALSGESGAGSLFGQSSCVVCLSAV